MTLPGAPVEVPTLTHGPWTLRPWQDADAPAVLDLAGDSAAWQWMGRLRRVTDLDEALRWIVNRRSAGRIDWAVTESETGRLAARVGLHDFDRGSRSAEVGYVVWPSYRRRGLATTLLMAAAEHGFGPLGLARISLHHACGNVASCGVATKAGFAFEGIERASWDHGDGELHDMHLHARLASDPPGRAPRSAWVEWAALASLVARGPQA